MDATIDQLDLTDSESVDFFVDMSWETEKENGLGSAVDGDAGARATHREELLGFVGEQTRKAVFCAREDGRRVGLAWVAETNPGEPWDLSHPHAWIYGIRVDPAHRRQGYAKRLLDAVQTWAAHQGFDRIGLHVLDRNRAAVALYEAAGYRMRNAYYQRAVTGEIQAHFQGVARVVHLDDDACGLVRQRFAALAGTTESAASEAEMERRYAAYEERYGSRPRTEVCVEARDRDARLVGCAWGYASSGDVVADRYVWLRDLCVTEALDGATTMQDLLTAVEAWAVERGLPAIRVPVHASELLLLQTLDRAGYKATNRFLFRTA